jgi:hypothetical protein
MNDNLNKLNCNNYHVYDHISNDSWFAQNGLRSLYEYSKISGSTFKAICLTLLNSGQVTIMDQRELTDEFPKRGALTLTLI